jgi:hypothetical protein
MKIKKLFICDQPHEHWYEYLYNSYKVNSPHNSKHLFDIYSITHVFWFALLSILLKNIKIFDKEIIIIALVFLSIVFEIHENTDKQIILYNRIEQSSTGISSYRGDSFINVIGDIACNFIGIMIGFNINYYNTFIILVILFLIITKMVGLEYWSDFLKFLFVS